MENINKFLSPISIAIILATLLSAIIGFKYVNTLEKENVSSTYNKDENTLSVKGKSEKIVTLTNIWATFEVPSVNLNGSNLTPENSALYEKKLDELTEKIKSLGVNEKDLLIEIVDSTDYTVEESEVKPIVKSKVIDLKSPIITEESEDYDEYPYYDYESDYDTDVTKDKKIFSVTLSAPIGKVTHEQLMTLAKDLLAKKVDIYNSLSREGYDKLSDELNNLAIKDTVKKAGEKANAFGKNAVLQNNSHYDEDMSSSIINKTTAKYFVEKTSSFKLE